MATVQTITKDQLFNHYLQKDLSPKKQGSVTVAFNMVATIDGVINLKSTHTGVATDRGLSNPIDQRLMRILRAKADCVLNGANTLRLVGTESDIDKHADLIDYRKQAGKPINPIAAIVTSKADFDDQTLESHFFTNPNYHSIVFVQEGAPAENLDKVKKRSSNKTLDIVTTSNRADNVKEIVQVLKDRYNVQTLLVEGGPGINGSFIKNGLGAHFFMTESPHIAIASHESKTVVMSLSSLLRDEMVNLTLNSAYYVEEVGALFQHWIFNRQEL